MSEYFQPMLFVVGIIFVSVFWAVVLAGAIALVCDIFCPRRRRHVHYEAA